MKKLLLLSFFLFMLILTSKAQDVIYGGIRVSPNYSVFIEKAQEEDKSGIGFNIGYFEVIELDNKFNIQAELNYSQYSFIYESRNNKVTYTTRSFDFPIALKYRVANNFAIGLGYQFSRGLTGTIKNESNTNDGERRNTAGLFLDANLKSSKNIFGLRVLNTNSSIYSVQSLNFSLYAGIGIF